MSSSPLVSICCITYNHEKYIAQAIDSFLMQVTDFDVEIVIGDDCSTDHTPLIIEAYRKKFPEKFRILKRTKNLGSQRNFYETIKSCFGKYVAICDGDDYWISKDKLQTQITILEAENKISFCCHRTLYLENNNLYSRNDNLFESSKSKIVTIQNFLFPNIIATNSIVFRNETYKKFDIQFRQGFKDILLFCILLNDLPGICLKDEMSVYRVHNLGIWSNASIDNQMIANYETAKLLWSFKEFKKYESIQKFVYFTSKSNLNLLIESKIKKKSALACAYFLFVHFNKKLSKWEKKQFIKKLFLNFFHKE